jgi:hypothetical protein
MSSFAVIEGRLQFLETNNGKFYHDLQLPAPDPFSSPTWVRVVADRRLGQPGQDVKWRCSLRGYRRTFERKNGEQGHAVELALDFVEAMQLKGAA